MVSSVEAETTRAAAAEPPFWATPPAYWMPRYFPASAWFTHGSFAAWLVDILRPRIVVELGTHFGFSCFAFAEAAQKLGLTTTVHALDTWVGDEHAGFYGEEVLRYVEDVASTAYPESVRLHRGLFSESRRMFDDASVDLLHIDGGHTYEQVLEDYTQWRGSLRDGGVVLFHDIVERENGFGVWRLWEEIAEPGRSFAFAHGHGLGVLGVGEVRAPALQALFDADAVTAGRIREDFSRWGDCLARQAWLETLPSELDEVRGAAADLAVRAAQLEARVAAQRDSLDAFLASTSWRVTAPLRALGSLRDRRR